mgnify:CR=1 FL=1
MVGYVELGDLPMQLGSLSRRRRLLCPRRVEMYCDQLAPGESRPQPLALTQVKTLQRGHDIGPRRRPQSY